MGNFIRLVATLTAIAAAASFGLSAVYNATKDITAEYKRQEEASARVEALACEPDAFFEETVTDVVVEGREFSYYTAYADESKSELLGYSFTAYGKGYSSTVETIVGVDTSGAICSVKITSQKETPGLGSKVEEVASQNMLWDVLAGRAEDESGVKPWFQKQFEGLGPDDLRVVKTSDEPGIVAITGATISSEAVTSSVKLGMETLASVLASTGADDAPQGATDEAVDGPDGGGPDEPDDSGDAETAVEGAETEQAGEAS